MMRAHCDLCGQEITTIAKKRVSLTEQGKERIFYLSILGGVATMKIESDADLCLQCYVRILAEALADNTEETAVHSAAEPAANDPR